ncbi:hypothetical protein X928_05360 [Petrotoga miotherma DSM 10691]|uniref:Uncharacterized protein n=2 Tax=Petrotoga TaxID=28236 RepID=A0A2K1PC40_9BACT|nr:hypothetical protein X928_05360 [Petrotoga miotherma DSM 10691]POZ90549.1 hypothetical protein AA81_11345 [Petrotoga halophila DSM 16923]
MGLHWVGSEVKSSFTSSLWVGCREKSYIFIPNGWGEQGERESLLLILRGWAARRRGANLDRINILETS